MSDADGLVTPGDDQPVPAGEFIRPPGMRSDGEDAGFWEGVSEGELRVQACSACGRLRFPPRPMCPSCRSFQRNWRVVSGKGTVWSFAVPHPPLLPAYAALAPYNVIVVSLSEDDTIRMVGNLVEGSGAAINSVDPETIRIGEPVEVVYRDAGGFMMPAWQRERS